MFYAILALVDPGDEVDRPGPRLPDLRVDDPLRRRRRRSRSRSARRTTSGSTSTSSRSLVTPRTRLLVINSPANPTGGVLTREDLERIAELAIRARPRRPRRRDLRPDPLRRREHVSIASLPGMAERTIVLDGFSKTYAMTGWRLGYAIVPPCARPSRSASSIINTISCAADVRPGRRGRGAARPAGRRRRDGRGVPRPARPRRRRPQRDPGHPLPSGRTARSTSSRDISGTGLTGASSPTGCSTRPASACSPARRSAASGATTSGSPTPTRARTSAAALERIRAIRRRAARRRGRGRRGRRGDRPRVFVARRIPDDGLAPIPRRRDADRLAGRAAAAARRAPAARPRLRRRPDAAHRPRRRRVPRRRRAQLKVVSQLRRRLRQRRRPGLHPAGHPGRQHAGRPDRHDRRPRLRRC